MSSEVVLSIIGWGGSALLVVSILQSNLTRLRVLNLASCVLLVAYNGAIAVWPMVAMNAALFVINALYLVRSLRERKRARACRPAVQAPSFSPPTGS